MMDKKAIQSYVMQEFRLYTWIFYYILGAILYKNKEKISFPKRYLFSILIFFTFFALLYMNYEFRIMSRIIDGQYAYNSVLMVLWCSAIFISSSSICLVRVDNIIANFSRVIFLIYALHMFFVKIYVDFTIFQSSWMQILGYIAILISTYLVSLVLLRIPFVNKISHI